MTEQDPKADGLDLAIGWLQKSIDELADVTRRVREVAPGTTPTTQTRTSDLPPIPTGVAEPQASESETGTPLLDRIGRDLTKMAREGLLAPVVGREEETAWISRPSCARPSATPSCSERRESARPRSSRVWRSGSRREGARRPEGHADRGSAARCDRGRNPVPRSARGTRPATVREASQQRIVLFLDEIDLLELAGDTQGGLGAAAVLKPALARGDIALIGATTGDEYRTTIARDDSLARRLSTLDVSELDARATLPILESIRDRIATSRKVVVSDDALKVLLDFADRAIVNRRLPDKAIDLVEQAVARALVDGRTSVEKEDAVATTEAWAKRASSTPTLERFGRDLTGLARAGRLGPIVGRDREIGAMIEILLRKTKRDPMLLGPAGSGKTAIVEGLAIRLASDDHASVPEPLRDVRLFDVALLPLAEAISGDATLLRDFLAEARHPSVIVFFDEIHLLAAPTVRNLAQALKPSLARGEIACIGATTGEEYQANIETDAALARRFTQIPLSPWTRGRSASC